MKPQRIQRKRTKGWRMPENTVYVGRGSAWGNPYLVGKDGTAEECIRKYIDFILPYKKHGPTSTMAHLMHSECMLEVMSIELRGKNLACWCSLDSPCHADWLLKEANDDANKPYRSEVSPPKDEV